MGGPSSPCKIFDDACASNVCEAQSGQSSRPRHTPQPKQPRHSSILCEGDYDEIGDLCHGKADGTKHIVPYTNCNDFVHCYQGCIRYRKTCVKGLVFDTTIDNCNWDYFDTCGQRPPKKIGGLCSKFVDAPKPPQSKPPQPKPPTPKPPQPKPPQP